MAVCLIVSRCYMFIILTDRIDRKTGYIKLYDATLNCVFLYLLSTLYTAVSPNKRHTKMLQDILIIC